MEDVQEWMAEYRKDMGVDSVEYAGCFHYVMRLFILGLAKTICIMTEEIAVKGLDLSKLFAMLLQEN